MNLLKKLMCAAVTVISVIACQTLQQTPDSFQVDANTVQLIGYLNEDFAAEPIRQLQVAPEGSTVNMFIFSPDGDPRPVPRILEAMKGKTTVCYAAAAGGGAFTVLQACTYRLVGKSVFMGTRAISVNGPVNNPAFQAIKKEIENYEALAIPLEAERVGQNEAEYRKLLEKGLFLKTADEVLGFNAADGNVEFSCDEASQTSTLSRIIHLNDQALPLVMTVCPNNRRLTAPTDVSADVVGTAVGIPLIQDTVQAAGRL